VQTQPSRAMKWNFDMVNLRLRPSLARKWARDEWLK
jgi:hypothetical protein